MYWIAFVPSFVATALLVLQGYSYFVLQKPTRYYAGGLTILLAGSGLILYFLLVTGALILSPEFRVAMAQGIPARVGMALPIMGISVAAGLGWHVTRCAKGLPSRLGWILGLGLVVGAVTIYRVPVLNPDDAVPLQIGCYDVWWPLLVVWLSTCFTESIVTALGTRNRWTRAWSAMLLPTGLGLEAVRRSHLGFLYANPHTLPLWKAAVLTGIPATMALGTMFFAEALKIQICLKRRWLRVGLPGVFGAFGLISSWFWVRYYPLHVPLLPRPWWLWLAWLVLLALFVWFRLHSLQREGNLKFPAAWESHRLSAAMALLAVCTIVAALADILRFALADPVWDLGVILVAWVVLLELFGGDPLREFAHVPAVQHILAAESPLGALKTAVSDWIGKRWDSASNWVREFFRVEKVASAILRVFVVLLLLIAAAEIPDAGKTIILPFNTVGLPKDEKEMDLGRMVSDRIANTIGLVGQEFRPDVLIYLPTGKSDEARVRVEADETESFQPAVVTGDLEIPGTSFKVPFNAITASIQALMRPLLKARVIHGTIHKYGDRYVLLVSSKQGETWRTEEPSRESFSPVGDVVTAAKGASPATQPQAGSIENRSSANPSEKVTGVEGLAGLADEIAYKIMSADRALAGMGIAQSWQAIPPFREGLHAWKEYDVAQDYRALSKSIEQFREAANLDPDFALAQYRLGRALTADGQPELAADAFRSAVRARPRFAAAHIALANLLYSFDEYYYQLPPAILQKSRTGGSESAVRRKEALDHWKQVIRFSGGEASVADRASAYNGLCQDAFVSHFSASITPGRSGIGPAYLAAFYCRRAGNLYSRLSPSLRAESQVRAVEAYSFYVLGFAVEWSGRTPAMEYTVSGPKGGEAEWHCSSATVAPEGISARGEVTQHKLSRSLYAHEALEYFQRAKAILPEDPSISCSIASASLALEAPDPRPMRDLVLDASVHLGLGHSFRESARTWGQAALRFHQEALDSKSKHLNFMAAAFESFVGRRERIAASYYRLALAEYQRAIDCAPTNTDALNSYAYTFWSWRSLLPATPTDPDVASNAEKYARLAVRLAAGGKSHTRGAILRSTLGEVLLGEGKVDDAIAELEKAEKVAAGELQKADQALFRHAYFNEIRWDLAQAYQCKDRDTTRASSELNEIMETEKTRETQPYSEVPDLLSRAVVCPK